MTAAIPCSSTIFCHRRKQSMYGRLDWNHMYTILCTLWGWIQKRDTSANPESQPIFNGTVPWIHHTRRFEDKIYEKFRNELSFCVCVWYYLLQLASHFVTSMMETLVTCMHISSLWNILFPHTISPLFAHFRSFYHFSFLMGGKTDRVNVSPHWHISFRVGFLLLCCCLSSSLWWWRRLFLLIGFGQSAVKRDETQKVPLLLLASWQSSSWSRLIAPLLAVPIKVWETDCPISLIEHSFLMLPTYAYKICSHTSSSILFFIPGE